MFLNLLQSLSWLFGCMQVLVRSSWFTSFCIHIPKHFLKTNFALRASYLQTKPNSCAPALPQLCFSPLVLDANQYRPLRSKSMTAPPPPLSNLIHSARRRTTVFLENWRLFQLRGWAVLYTRWNEELRVEDRLRIRGFGDDVAKVHRTLYCFTRYNLRRNSLIFFSSSSVLMRQNLA